MTGRSLKSIVGAIASGRARATWHWKTGAAIVPILVAFIIQQYFFRPTMARWVLFYPAVFISSWLGGLSSGLAATALASALVPIFFMTSGQAELLSPANLLAAFIFVTMGIATSVLHERLRDLVGELEQKRRWLQAIMDNSPNVIVIKDFAGRYLMANRRLEEMLRVGAGEIHGKTDAVLFPAAVAEQHHQTDVDAVGKGAPITYEEAVELDGITRVFQTSKFPMHDAAGEPFAICAIWSDITERKRTEEALRQRESDLRAAERIAHLGSWTWTISDDTTRWSDELYRIFGREPPSPLPNVFRSGEHPFTPESLTELRKGLQSVARDGRPYQTELEIVRPDGTTRWIAARGDAVRDDKGTIIAVAGTAQDVTDLKELQRLRDEWTSVIAHDLRQPIGVILMAASALPELIEKSMTDKEKAFTSRITSAAQGLARLVDDLLDLSLLAARRLKLERRCIEPHAFVGETVERLAHVTAGHRVTITEGKDLADIMVDPMRIGQVLGNLISNAAKYGDKDSEIAVHLEQRDAELEIIVTNTGPGIPGDDIPRIFNRFMRTATARQSGASGLGVGLYIAKELTEAHGGRIWVESTPGKTTTFHMLLPSRTAARQVA